MCDILGGADFEERGKGFSAQPGEEWKQVPGGGEAVGGVIPAGLGGSLEGNAIIL